MDIYPLLTDRNTINANAMIKKQRQTIVDAFLPTHPLEFIIWNNLFPWILCVFY
jgi:hypothetical protein